MQSKAVIVGVLWVLLCVGVAASMTLRGPRPTDASAQEQSAAQAAHPAVNTQSAPAESTNTTKAKVFVEGTSDDVTSAKASIKK